MSALLSNPDFYMGLAIIVLVISGIMRERRVRSLAGTMQEMCTHLVSLTKEVNNYALEIEERVSTVEKRQNRRP